MKKNPNKNKMSFAVFTSFKEENRAEYFRRSRMTPRQRLDEFAILQERAWGAKWTKERMKKVFSFEMVSW